MRKAFFFILLLVFMAGCSAGTPPTAETGTLTAGAQEVGGVILGGGDQTPEGLMDTPRVFIYQVRLDAGEEINVTYTAFPPGPAGQDLPSPKLVFNNGAVTKGEYLVAKGTYDPETKTLTVATETDFIETYSKKP